ncbi:hypothetical protein ACN4EE_18620 [Geminocystis sp. CENA526]|uniref:hypothetical protein n=1 Tax=Geminocystis sp. CENA526 TaxID=1355871 RepID=UPI003D6EC90C
MIKNNKSLWDNLFENTCKSQQELLKNILKPEKEKLKLLLEYLYSSGYEISFQHKKIKQKISNKTLRIRKIIEDKNIHYGYINQDTLDGNSLFGYCLGFKSDKCPDNFSHQIYGFSEDKGFYIIKIEGNEKGWYLVEGKRTLDKDKYYILITSIELAHKIFNI